MSFKYPLFLGLIIIPAAYLIFYILYLKAKKASFKLSSKVFLDRVPKGMRAHISELPLYLKLLASVFVIIAIICCILFSQMS